MIGSTADQACPHEPSLFPHEHQGRSVGEHPIIIGGWELFGAVHPPSQWCVQGCGWVPTTQEHFDAIRAAQANAASECPPE